MVDLHDAIVVGEEAEESRGETLGDREESGDRVDKEELEDVEEEEEEFVAS